MLRYLLALRPLELTLYLVSCVAISGFALGSFAQLVQEYLTPSYSYSKEGFFVLGQVIFQWAFMGGTSWLERKKYAIIALTISMLGSLLILPLIGFHSILGVPALGATIYFFGVVGVIFVIHHYLVRRERLPGILSVTWVLYRLLLLIYLTFPGSAHDVQ